MGIDYDPTDTSEYSTPVVGIPTWVTIGQCEETTSGSSGKNMLVLNVSVDKGEEGAGYKTKEYLVQGVNWKIRQVLRSCNLDPEVKHPIDDIFFRDRQAQVIFKAEDWIGNDGSTRTGYKIDKWVPYDESEPKAEVAMQAQKPEEEYTDSIPFK